MKRAIISWSGGKDAAWALHRVRGEYEVVALLTTLAEETALVPIHNVPLIAIEAQAQSLGLPLRVVRLPQPCSNAEYTRLLAPVWETADADTVVFGDLFLSDIREWRENLLATTRLTPAFPLWLEPTAELAREMIRGGLRARVCAAHDPQLIGRDFDETFLAELPPHTDPCGENGEFHTFVRSMPGFAHEITREVA